MFFKNQLNRVLFLRASNQTNEPIVQIDYGIVDSKDYIKFLETNY